MCRGPMKQKGKGKGKGKGKKGLYRIVLLAALLLTGLTGGAWAQTSVDLNTSNRLSGTYAFTAPLTRGATFELAANLKDATRVYAWGPDAGQVAFVTQVRILLTDAAGTPTPTLLGTSTVAAGTPAIRLVLANTEAAVAKAVGTTATPATTWNTFSLRIVRELTGASPEYSWDSTSTIATLGIKTNADLLKYGFLPSGLQAASTATAVYWQAYTKDFSTILNRRPMAGAQELPLLPGLRLLGDDSPGRPTDSDTNGDALCLIWPPSFPGQLFSSFQVFVDGYYFLAASD